ncbi:hypothetical protein ElyMa_000300600 [Elysia marginata]|uniref:Ig-like domain-containing protein n=1 Tax=Elysia marginata TaxID=1093978 RepID=A0AAV4F9H0_9GAST|nr:hypothetical protein ElyMa_000300600 [Elysia marginata]
MPVQELGEGTHSFLGYIYPDVTGGLGMVNGIEPNKTVTLSFPQVSHSCLTNMKQGYFIGKSARCICRATFDGYPKGSGQWYKEDQTVRTIGDLGVTYNESNPEQVYTCETKSALGRKPGSTLIAKFAFIDPDSVQIASSSSEVNLRGNNNQVQVACKISRDHVSPAPTFSFSVDGPRSQGPQPGTHSSDDNYYQSQFSLSPDVVGQYQVTCRVTNSVTTTWQDNSTKITFYTKPENPSCTLSEDTRYGTITSVDVTCSTSKVYPEAKCSFYRKTNGGNDVKITRNPLYSHKALGSNPVYYSSQCSVSMPVQELGEGTHSFLGYIYPDVTGGLGMVNGIEPNKTVTLNSREGALPHSQSLWDGPASPRGQKFKPTVLI